MIVDDRIMRGSRYFDEAFEDNLDEMVHRAKGAIPRDVDTLVGTGLSGALVVPTLARAMGLHWGIVRKETDLQGFNSHAENIYEGSLGRRWALVDDFVSSGATVARALGSVNKEFGPGAWRGAWVTEFVGVFQYAWTRRERPWLTWEYFQLDYPAKFRNLRPSPATLAAVPPLTEPPPTVPEPVQSPW